MTRDEIEKNVIRALRQVTGDGEIDISTQLGWVLLDSLDQVELTMEIEKLCGVYVEPELFTPERFRCVSNIVEYVLAKKSIQFNPAAHEGQV